MDKDAFQSTQGDAGTSTEVKLYVCHGKFFVWDPLVAMILRKSYRIVGCCFGCFPAKPRQISQLSLPFMLSNIEAKFVVEHEEIVLLNSTTFPKDLEFDRYQEQIKYDRKIQFQIQTKLKQEQKNAELDQMAPEIKQGKLKKMYRKKLKPSEDETIQEDSTIILEAQIEKNLDEEKASSSLSVSMCKNNFDADDFETFKKSELKKVEQFGAEQTWVKLPTESLFKIKYPNMKASDIVLNDEEKLKYAVFCDLHAQGYFVTDGLKFGGDFLVYPGDPGLYHSLYIVVCVPLSKQLSLADYSALGRLATSVKKTLLLCSVDLNNQINYLSFAWSGIV